MVFGPLSLFYGDWREYHILVVMIATIHWVSKVLLSGAGAALALGFSPSLYEAHVFLRVMAEKVEAQRGFTIRLSLHKE